MNGKSLIQSVHNAEEYLTGLKVNISWTAMNPKCNLIHVTQNFWKQNFLHGVFMDSLADLQLPQIMRGSGLPPLLRFLVPLQTLQRGPSPPFSSFTVLSSSRGLETQPPILIIQFCNHSLLLGHKRDNFKKEFKDSWWDNTANTPLSITGFILRVWAAAIRAQLVCDDGGWHDGSQGHGLQGLGGIPAHKVINV